MLSKLHNENNPSKMECVIETKRRLSVVEENQDKTNLQSYEVDWKC